MSSSHHYGSGRTSHSSSSHHRSSSSSYYGSSSSSSSHHHSSSHHSSSSSRHSSSHHHGSSSSSRSFPSSTQFTYSTGNPYEAQLKAIGTGAISGKAFPPGIGDGTFRGRGRGRGGGRGRGKQMPKKVKPPPPVPLAADQKLRIENHNMKQLVAPKPPHRILNEMVGGGAKFEYTENPPLPPGMMVEDMPAMHTLITEVDGDTSTGTGPTHEIAKNICAEHAIMNIVTKRYDNMNSLAAKGIKSKEEMLLEDETPFEIASIALFKMLNEWEAGGFELPRSIDEVLYSNQPLQPVKQRLGWIRGSNLGFTTPLSGVGASGRKRPMPMPTGGAGSIEQKQPVAFLNEIRGSVLYTELGSVGTGPHLVFSMGTNIDGVAYSGTGATKKEAKKNCARDVLAKLYKINM